MFTCVDLQVVTVGCHRISQHPQFDSKFNGFVLHKLFKPKTTLEWHHCLIHRDMLMWHILILKVLMHTVQNVLNFVQFVSSVDKVEISTDLKESVSTHDISKSSVEEEAFTPLVPVMGISVQFDDVFLDDKAIVCLQLIHRQHFPISLVVVRVTFLSSSRILICRIYQILKDLFCVEEFETLQRCD